MKEEEENVTLGRLRELARRRATKERNIQMLREHLEGASIRDVAKQHGLSANHVSTIIRSLTWFHFRGSPHFQLPPDIAAKLKELRDATQSPASDSSASAQSPTSGSAPRSK
jgi:transposase-like protein